MAETKREREARERAEYLSGMYDDPCCYFADGALECKGDLWQCQNCGEWFCQTHFHVSAKGRNVECCACEENTPAFIAQYGPKAE